MMKSKIICSGEALENFQFITVNGKVIFEDKDSSYWISPRLQGGT
jgi:hypothetical protein